MITTTPQQLIEDGEVEYVLCVNVSTCATTILPSHVSRLYLPSSNAIRRHLDRSMMHPSHISSLLFPYSGIRICSRVPKQSTGMQAAAVALAFRLLRLLYECV